MPPKRPLQAGVASKPKRTRNAYKELPQQVQNEHNDCIHVKTVPSAKSTTSFLSLPRELRDQIYHEVWRSMPPFQVTLPTKGDHKSLAEASGFHIDHYLFRIVYEMSYEPVISLIELQPKQKKRRKSTKAALVAAARPSGPWFLASKQVLYEAMKQFNSHVTWTHTGRLKDEKLQPAAWKALLIKRRSTRLGPLLLGLQNAANIHLPTRVNMYVYGIIDAKESPVSSVEFDRSATELLHPFTTGIAGTTQLKSLLLGLQANAWRGGANDHPITIDLRPLDTLDLPNLQVLQLAVSFNAEFHADQRLMVSLREGLRMLGKKLFNGAVREQFHERYVPQALVNVEWCLTWTKC